MAANTQTKFIRSTSEHPAAPIRTQEQVAKILGMKRHRVYELEKRALAKIRKALEEAKA